MRTRTIDVNEAHMKLDEVLVLLAEGDEIVLTDGTKPVARIVRMDDGKSVAQERVPDLFAGAIWTSEDFDQPLPDEFWLASE
jgi:antitoxin (DNA-binding transcriptional repressor) of toxin-antitoxin stability system